MRHETTISVQVVSKRNLWYTARMRNPSLDESPRTANLDTNTPPQASRPPDHSGDTDGYEGPLPADVLRELLRRKPRTRQQSAKTKRSFPPWLKSTLTFAASVLALVLMLAAIAVAISVTGWTPTTRHYSDPALARTFHPMPDPPALAPTPSLANAPSASQPDWSVVYREWVPQAGGWVLTNAECVPFRGSFIADPAPRALPAAPRAELVSMPVRRATLAGN
jgi:hypothetical protein